MSNFYYFSYDIFCDISVKKTNNILFCSILSYEIAL